MSVCVYCGRRLPLLHRVLGTARFCSKQHLELHQKEVEALALEALGRLRSGAEHKPERREPLGGLAPVLAPVKLPATPAAPPPELPTPPEWGFVSESIQPYPPEPILNSGASPDPIFGRRIRVSSSGASPAEPHPAEAAAADLPVSQPLVAEAHIQEAASPLPPAEGWLTPRLDLALPNAELAEAGQVEISPNPIAPGPRSIEQGTELPIVWEQLTLNPRMPASPEPEAAQESVPFADALANPGMPGYLSQAQGLPPQNSPSASFITELPFYPVFPARTPDELEPEKAVEQLQLPEPEPMAGQGRPSVVQNADAAAAPFSPALEPFHPVQPAVPPNEPALRSESTLLETGEPEVMPGSGTRISGSANPAGFESSSEEPLCLPASPAQSIPERALAQGDPAEITAGEVLALPRRVLKSEVAPLAATAEAPGIPRFHLSGVRQANVPPVILGETRESSIPGLQTAFRVRVAFSKLLSTAGEAQLYSDPMYARQEATLSCAPTQGFQASAGSSRHLRLRSISGAPHSVFVPRVALLPVRPSYAFGPLPAARGDAAPRTPGGATVIPFRSEDKPQGGVIPATRASARK